MPSNVSNPDQDSLQPLLLEVIFLGEPRTTRPVVLSRDFVESFTITLTNKSSWTGNLVLFDRTGDFLLDVLSLAGQGRVIQLRWGWDSRGGLGIYPQFTARWTVFQPEFTAEGVRLTFDLIAAPVYEQVLDRKPRTFKAGIRVSEAVRIIAEDPDRKWSTVNRRGEATIEDTDAVLDAELVLAAGESDYKFIMNRLLPRTAPEGGTPFHCYFDDQNTFHFHSDGFLDDTVAAKYIFGQDAMGDVIEFAPADLKFFSAVLGGGSAVYWGVDSFTGQRLRLATTDAGGLPGLRSQIDSGAAFLTQPLPLKLFSRARPAVSAVIPMMSRTQDDFIQKVQAKFTRLRQAAYGASLTVRGTHAVVPTAYVRVEYLTAAKRQPHFLTGTFRVLGVEHEVSSSGWQTRMDLFREGVQETDGAQAIEQADKITPKVGPDAQGKQQDARSVQAAKERRQAREGSRA